MPSPEQLVPVESASAPDYYTWTFPGAPVRIHLRLSVVERLSREVRRAFASVPSYSAEIGGLLLGTADLYASHIIEITDFEPFLCEYRSSHKFVLSAADRNKLDKTLAEHRAAPAGQHKIVGYYRSHVGDGLSLSQDDLSIVQAYFSDPASVFLLVKPSSDGSASAGFFFWDKGHIDSEFTFLEFPFDAPQLTGARVKPTWADSPPDLPLETPESAVAEPELVPAVANFYEEPPAEPEEPHGRNGTRSWYTLFAALMIVVGALGYQAYTRWQLSSTPSTPASDAPPLSLQVERRGGDLRVAWNRTSYAVRHAKDAVLLIHDGEAQEQELRLDLDQLRTGSVLYTPVASAVQFRLEVTAEDGGKTSENVFALTAPKPAAAGGPPAVQSSARQPAAAPPIGNRSAEPAGANTSSLASRSALGDPVRVVMIDPPSQAAPRSPLLPQPGLGPAGALLQTGANVAARPIRQSQPSLPPSVRAKVTSPVEVQIKVEIDDSGRVVNAYPLASTGPVNPFLVGAARNAARLWMFEPARRGDRPVSSEMILKFQYRPVKADN
jgi:hypothetical protein